MNEEKIFANAFNQSLQIGPAGLKKIREYFGSFKNAWPASFKELEQVLDKKEFKEFRQKIDPEKEFEILQKENIKILLLEEFPEPLKETYLAPQILYIKGNLPETKRIHLAVVGTRKFSSYGKEACEKIVSELKEHDVVIVSGMALGIDTIAHKTALDNKMETMAVLGCGLSPGVVYPYSNKKLAQEIIEKGGCIISEYPYSMKAALFTFPQRNRIVAGISQGTLVVEAPERSGALITAFLALEYNREVFAVPGGIFGINSKGVNNLLKMGATPVTTSDDMLRAFGIEPDTGPSHAPLSATEKKVIDLLYDPLERDGLIRKLDLPIKETNPLLSQMEIKGIIKEIDGKIYKI